MQLFWKRLFLSCLCGTACLTFALGQAHAARYLTNGAKVQVDNQLVGFPDAEPFIDPENQLQVPLRFVSEVLGFKVDWQMAGGQVRVSLGKGGTAVTLTTGQKEVQVNGKKMLLESAPFFSGGRVYVPLRFIADSLQLRIQWDNQDRIAILDKDGLYHAPAWYAPKAPEPEDFVATAYSDSPSENGKWGGLDYMGNPLQLGTISVDPSVIPLGSKVWITGYDFSGLPAGGFMAKASDVGSAIKGNRVDIYIPGPKDQARSFGIQHVEISVIQ